MADQFGQLTRKIKRNIKQLPKKFRNGLKRKEGAIANQALAKLTQEPGPPIYPIQWSSERQRRAFFATDGFGRGIPTRRSGALLEAWDVVVLEDGIALVNDDPSEPFVQGANAQPFHLDTGWIQEADVADDFIKEFGIVARQTWEEEADILEGV